MKLLIVEDNIVLITTLNVFLSKEGYVCEYCDDAYDALHLLDSQTFDAVILDINLGESSGYTVIKKLREDKKNMPIVVISALSEIDQRIKGLELGADDYLTKPFDNLELLARLKALLRRASSIKENKINYKELSVDLDTCMATRNQIDIPLRKKEFLLLEYLLLNKGIILSRFQLLDRVWGSDSDIDSNKVDAQIKNLRKKIDFPFDEGYIKTVRGLGYVLR
jgi:two-component system, OmpR family, copper resistance phosphate regulon response regulator CusR